MTKGKALLMGCFYIELVVGDRKSRWPSDSQLRQIERDYKGIVRYWQDQGL